MLFLSLASIAHLAGAIDRVDHTLKLFASSHALFGDEPAMEAQDQYGFYWSASRTGGLYRFDGVTSTHYQNDPDNPYSLASNRVMRVYEDRKRRLWVGTEDGLQRFDFETGRFITVPLQVSIGPKNSAPHVFSIFHDRVAEDVLWVGTRSGLFRLDLAAGTQQHFTHQDQNPGGLPSKSLGAIAQDDGGSLWMRTGRGVIRLRTDPWRLEMMSPPASSTNDGIYLSPYRKAMHVWYLHAQGLYRIDPVSRGNVKVGLEDGLPEADVLDVSIDRSGRMWVCSMAGVYLWNAERSRFERFLVEPDDPSLFAKPTAYSHVFEDDQGNLWMTLNGSLGRINMNGAGFQRLLTTRASVKSIWDNAPSLLYREGDHLWIGSSHGLDRLNVKSGKVRSYPHDPADPRSVTRSDVAGAIQGNNGELVFMSYFGVNLYRPETDSFERLFEPEKQPVADRQQADQIVFAIAWDRFRNGIWISTAAGLRLLDLKTRRQTAFISRHEFPLDGVTMHYGSILVDRTGTLWAGGTSGPLWVARIRLDGNNKPQLSTVPHDKADEKTLSDPRATYFFEDGAGDIWIGTAKGLNRVVTAADGSTTISRYGARQGLSGESIRCIVEDKDGVLWVATDKGISRIAADRKQVFNYVSADGFEKRPFSNLRTNRGGDGMLYFSQDSGILAFNPDTLGQQRTITPRMALTGIAVMHEPLDRAALPNGVGIDGPNAAPRSLTLPYTHSVFSLGFAALGASDPASAVYAHKLDGFDRDWIRTDADRRIATYTNLEPGDYVFRVNATTMDGMRSPQDLVLPITITPPFWKTWWFRTLALALVVAATYWAHRLRIRFLQRSYELKTLTIQARAELDVAAAQQRFVAMVSHEFRNPLALMETALGNLSRMRGEMPAGVSERLQKIQRARQRMQGLIDNYLTEETMKSPDLNPRRQETALLTLVQDVVDYAQGAAPKHQIGLEAPAELPLMFIDREMIRVALSNLLDNAVKYSPQGGAIRMRVAQQEEQVVIEVEDSGVGIPEEQLPQIFDKFFRADHGKESIKGVGLGLHLVKKIVDLHEGSITVRSQVGVSTTFILTLPLRPAFD
ncbi:sensor histidine kinase [Noviherbaspirillum galbum]|uniref:histidine kinase n=1 Tax=Noviherbaspirillum galbum TaxID=2709383 RepID=A0A6B3SMR7_9BURK|nr:sensor histidine kinase [Noviherbaspirillum galbum]NEX62007.1 GHKL domain-containing protein [Noviherbaspirillum galbum]